MYLCVAAEKSAAPTAVRAVPAAPKLVQPPPQNACAKIIVAGYGAPAGRRSRVGQKVKRSSLVKEAEFYGQRFKTRLLAATAF